ncbi:hypothetical protein ACOMHN_023261 [Nucella lapillus]
MAQIMRTKWLLLSVVVMVMILTMGVQATPPPTTQSAADDRRGCVEEKEGCFANPIRPIAHGSPLEVREGDPNSNAAVAANFLIQFGYHRKRKPLDFLASPPGRDPSQSGDEQTQAIRLFQRFFDLEQTGKLDEATLSLMKKDRCGVADIPEVGDEPSANPQSPSKYALLGQKWDKNILSWKLDTRSTRQLSPSIQREVMKEAFDTWRRVTPLHFVEESGSRKVDIDIKFGAGDHGDKYPFDGAGKVLAHAFGPGEGDIDGDMHIDDEDDWSSAKEGGNSDLYLVATHELGHSLGLSHSRDPAALMYPYYGLTDKLGPDDIKAIQSLYGIRIGQPTTRAPITRRPRPTTPTTTTRRPTRRPTRTERPRPRHTTTTTTPRPQSTTLARECGVKFDVVIQDPIHKHLYNGIRGNAIYLFNTGGVLPGYPAHLHSVYPEAPSYAESVFTVPEKQATYFVKDNKVWRYHGSLLDGDYPKDLDPTHFPEVIRFVLPMIDSTGHRRIFVFGRTLWWEYNFDDVPTGSYFRPRPNLIPQYWPAISSDVSYAVLGSDNYIYLIMPHAHVVLDSFRRAMHGGKQDGHPQWMMPACRMRQTSSGAANVKNFGLTWCVAVLNLLLLLLTKC